MVSQSQVFNYVNKMCRENHAPRINYPEFFGTAEELEGYGFIRIDQNKKDLKTSLVALQVDLTELLSELDKLNSAAATAF